MPEERRGYFYRTLDNAAWVAWRALIVAAAVIAIAYVLSQVRVVMLALIGAIFVTAVLVAPFHWLQRRGVPKLVAVWLVMLGAFLVLAGLVGAVVPSFMLESEDFGDQLIGGVEELQEFVSSGPFGIPAETANQWVDDLILELQENAPNIATGVLRRASTGLEIVTGLVLMVPLVFFLLKDGDVFRGLFLRMFSDGRRGLADVMLTRVARALSEYLRGVVILATVDSLFIAIGLIVLDVPFVVLLAILTFVGAFIPIVGATLAGMAAVLVALVSGGIVDAAIMFGIVIAVQQIEGNVLAPLVLGRAVKLHPVVILLSVTGAGILWGIIGAFLAVPTAAALTAVLDEILAQHGTSLTGDDHAHDDEETPVLPPPETTAGTTA